MSAQMSRDVSHIKDEEVLRKMWQDTDDFAKKKEIRSHMYKLREERLRNFYSSSDSEIQRAHTSSTFHEKTTKEGNGPTHADSLADHSFLSLKSKEIRDSESPTREMHYRITDQGRVKDQGWNVETKAETSADGKTHTTAKLATTSGTENIKGGVATYAGKCEQKTSEFSDGDANNFTKSLATNSNTVLQQEASGGDANSTFKSFSTSSSSSSKFVSQHKSTNENVTQKALPQDEPVIRKTYTTNVPAELKNNPNYIDGNTKVTTETRTLPDGTRVTTTRYETKGAKTTSSADHYSSEQVVSEQKSATTKSSTTKSHSTTKNQETVKPMEKIIPVCQNVIDTSVQSDLRQGSSQNIHEVKVTKSHVQESRGFDVNVESNRTNQVTTDNKTVTDTSRKEDIRTSQDRQDDVRTMQVIKEQNYLLRDDYPRQSTEIKVVKSQDTEKWTEDVPVPSKEDRIVSTTKTYDDKTILNQDKVCKTSLDDRQTSSHKETITSKTSLITATNEKIQDDVHIKRVIQEKELRDTIPQPRTPAIRTPGDQTPITSTPGNQTPILQEPSRPLEPSSDVKTTTTVIKYTGDVKSDRSTTDDFINIERIHVQDTQPKQKEPYYAPEKREPIRPGKSELDEKPKPTEGQYSTTYRTDYVNRRISVEVSPTHDAFARSLRAVTPDRDKKRASTRSLKSSTSSLRSSTSPEKSPDKRYTRTSPERKYQPDSRGSSPIKRTTPDKYMPERISSPRTSPNKYCSDTLTKKRKDETTRESHKQIDSSTLTRRSKTRPRSRSVSPTSIASDIEYVKPNEMVTDLDDEISTTITTDNIKKYSETKRVIQEKRPTSLNVITTTTKKTRKITDRSPTSPLTELRDKPSEKQLKRRDTYEDRCRQILGISDIVTVDKKTVETRKTRNKVDEVSPKKPTKVSPSKDFKSPDKPLKEYPSQIRRTPEKEPLRKTPEKRQPSKESPTIQEFPSQIRRTPEKQTPQTRGSPSGSPKKQTVDHVFSEVQTQKTTEIRESQIRSSPERKINGFPSQTSSPERELRKESPPRRSPGKESTVESRRQTQELLFHTEKKDLQHKDVSTVQLQEFPSQIRKSPEKQIPETSPGKEFSSQRRTPERDLPKSTSEAPKIQEFPSQIRRSPDRQRETFISPSESPKIVSEPLCKRKSIDLLCREDEIKNLHQSTYQPHKTVKKDSPERTLPRNRSPEPKRFVNETFIDKERVDTDVTINDFYKQQTTNKTASHETVSLSKLTNIATIKREGSEERKSPTRLDRTSPTRSDRSSPTRSSPTRSTSEKDKKVTKTTTYVDDYCTPISSTISKLKSASTEKKTTEVCNVNIRKTPKTNKMVTTRTIKITANGDVPKRSPISGKPKHKQEPIEYPSQKPKFEMISPKTITKYSTNKTIYSVEKVYNVDKVQDVKINGDIKTYKPRKPDEKKQIFKPTHKPEIIKIHSFSPDRKGKGKENVETTECTIRKTTIKETRLKPDSPSKPTPKRHVVTTTIQVLPKVTLKKTPQKVYKVTPIGDRIKTQSKIKPKKPNENGHITTEDDSEIEVIDTKRVTENIIKTDQKLTRTISDQIIKTKKVPTRGLSKPELISSQKPETEKVTKKPRKIITTKSIVINNDLEDEKEVVINLQRSTSSREPTPDQVYPRPASADEDTGAPRYPDQIYEPDEPALRKKPTRLSDIPIIETDDVTNFSRITEVATERVDKVDETDECLLSVNQKVNKFVDEAEKLTKPKSPRRSPPLDQKEKIRENKIVSEKITKFTNSQQLAANQDFPERPKSPRCRYYPDDDSVNQYPSVSEKVSHFIETAEKVKHSQKPTKEGLSPKGPLEPVTKFITQERQSNVSLSKIDITPKKQPLRESPRRESPTSINTECVQIETEEQTYTRKSSFDRRSTSRENSPLPGEKTPKSSRPTTLVRDTKDTKYTRKSSLKDIDSTPKSSRVDGEPRSVLSPTGRLRSTESIRRAKELFENMAKDQKSPKQKDILNRPSVLGQKPYKPDGDVKLTDIGIYKDTNTFTCDTLKSTRLIMDKLGSKSPDQTDAPHYLQPLDRSPRPRSPYQNRSSPISSSPTRDRSPRPHSPSLDEIPHYMWPLDRNLKEHSPERSREPTPDRKLTSRGSTPDRSRYTPDRSRTPDKNVPSYMKPLERQVRPKSPSPKYKQEDYKTTKGVAIKTNHRKKLTVAEIERILNSDEIEEIYDVEVLEILLERALSYEQRRKIRYQIRIVKQLIFENKLESVLNKKSYKTKEKSVEKSSIHDRRPTEDHTEYSSRNRIYHHADTSQERRYSETSSYTERRTSSEFRKEIRKSTSPEPKNRGKSPEKNKEPTTASPDRTETKNVFKTELRKTAPVTKTVVEEKPVWATQRPLKKATERTVSSTSTTITKKQTSRASPTKERKSSNDIITSSYGVGPTDENGSPLFGLKALRAHNRTDTTKVQGTVIRSHYYSENGQEPVGQISVTKYSTDPRDLDGHTEDRNGLVSVTTTRKFPAKGTPSTKSITDKKTSVDEDVIKKQSTTVTRRGSVKEMSKKFIENAVETSKSERQSSYPKAGLILRTSSFKDTAKGSRESSPEKQESVKTLMVEKTVVSSGGNTESFLSNKIRVTGVQDVITRMKNADEFQDGDSVEDREAKALLNKFIGSQVILSGLESHSSSSQSPVTTTLKRTTTTTTTTSKGGGKPTVTTRTFTHPITEADLATVWDEQTLKLLLERSTDYEERQIIRARIRDVMAEKEVCADVMTKTEESGGRVEESVETKSATEGTVTTSKVTTSMTSQQVTKKPISPFAKFRQLDKQNSLNTPPGTPKTPTGSRPLFKFTDPEVGRQASTVKERLLQWCQMKTKEYENINLENFSTSWADGLAFCALIHHFLPDAFDYQALTPKDRKHNFSLAFRIADEKANIMPLLDVEDMIATRKPDWKCVFTYVQTIYSRFKDED